MVNQLRLINEIGNSDIGEDGKKYDKKCDQKKDNFNAIIFQPSDHDKTVVSDY